MRLAGVRSGRITAPHGTRASARRTQRATGNTLIVTIPDNVLERLTVDGHTGRHQLTYERVIAELLGVVAQRDIQCPDWHRPYICTHLNPPSASAEKPHEDFLRLLNLQNLADKPRDIGDDEIAGID